MIIMIINKNAKNNLNIIKFKYNNFKTLLFQNYKNFNIIKSFFIDDIINNNV